ncbi:hypothetical protein K456DRAFT_1756355 [Colletotrichum gloeosporioides 23]|nr:hypothetical protein K456DRAFT_1756355 [Colletotrichum gloeosporioides 23]
MPWLLATPTGWHPRRFSTSSCNAALHCNAGCLSLSHPMLIVHPLRVGVYLALPASASVLGWEDDTPLTQRSRQTTNKLHTAHLGALLLDTPDFPRSTADDARDSLGQPGPIGNDKRPTTASSSSSPIDNHQRQTLQAAATSSSASASAFARHEPSTGLVLLFGALQPWTERPYKLGPVLFPSRLCRTGRGGNGGEATPASPIRYLGVPAARFSAITCAFPVCRFCGRRLKNPARMYMSVASTEAGLSAAAIATRCQSPRAPEPGFQVTIQVQRQAQVQVRCNGRRVFNCPPGLVSTEEAWIESIPPLFRALPDVKMQVVMACFGTLHTLVPSRFLLECLTSGPNCGLQNEDCALREPSLGHFDVCIDAATWKRDGS